jgi:hypothetical protein
MRESPYSVTRHILSKQIKSCELDLILSVDKKEIESCSTEINNIT